MELWDAYDRDMKKIENMILFREKGVPDGFYHLVSEILVRHTDGSFLVMQRDMSKHLGGKWEATAGGSALRGETSAYKWISRDELLTLSDDSLASSRLIKVYTAGGN